MAPLYSARIFSGQFSIAGTVNYTVPTGFILDVRDVVLWYGGTAGTGAQGCEVYDGTGAVIFGVFTPQACAGNPYHWDGRQVLDPGTTLSITALEGGWHYRVSGYLLTSP